MKGQEAQRALLVCWRVIRYQGAYLAVSRGFSFTSGMSRKCPPELKSGVDRVLDVHTPTCDTCILTWGGLMSSVRPDPPSLRATLDAFNALMRAVPWVYHREGSRPEASSKDKTPATQEQRERLCSKQHRAGCSWPLDPFRSSISTARLLPLHPVSKQSPAGLSRLQRGLQHEDEVPCRAAERKRSRARDTHTNVRHFDPQSGRPDVKSRRKPPSFSAMFGAFNALLRTVPRVHHREESRPEASGEEKTPATQGKRKK